LADASWAWAWSCAVSATRESAPSGVDASCCAAAAVRCAVARSTARWAFSASTAGTAPDCASLVERVSSSWALARLVSAWRSASVATIAPTRRS
jgi:hypothetical protein